jgi:hypothetical protein
VHVEEEPGGRLIAVVDAIREAHPPFDPEEVTADCAALLEAYGLRTIHGDRFAGGWTDAAFRRWGITYQCLPFTKSEAYVDFLRLVHARQVELPDAPRLLQQATGLQRRAGAQGRDVVDHASGGHDDVVNAVAAACVLVHRLASAPRRSLEVW